jgi:sialate O-acetylesterase
LLLFFVSLSASFTVNAQSLALDDVFGDHMVLQRNYSVPISGTGTPNTTVNLRFVSNNSNHNYETKIDNNGHWRINIEPQKAGGPFDLYVEQTHKSSTENHPNIKINDVYFGDVWLASGQSNMEWKLKWQVNNWEAEVADSNFPLIRFFDVPNVYKSEPQDDLQSANWTLASSDTSSEYSAVAWFFAKHLHTDKNVPIGIIDSTWGGTPAEAWTPLETLLNEPGYKEEAQAYLDEPAKWQATFDDALEEQKAQQQLLNKNPLTDANSEILLSFSKPQATLAGWQKTSLPLTNASSDILWARRAIDIAQSELDAIVKNAKPIELDIGYYSPQTQVFINAKPIKQGEGASKNDPFLIPVNYLKSGENVLMFRTANAWDNRVNIGNINQLKLYNRVNDERRVFAEINDNWAVNNRLEGVVPMPRKYYQASGVLYNAMIHPIEHYPLKGVIWYQGESNVSRASEYESLFTNMIRSWRQKWQQADLPFLFVQLASMHPQRDQPMQSSWAELREAQTKTLKLDNTAMAVIIDAGEAYDIHPRNKQIVGERLYLAAKAVAYGDEVVYSGPSIVKHRVQENEVILHFDSIGDGLMLKGDTLLGFEVAGKDGEYANAQGYIRSDESGNYVVVSSMAVTSPVSVRYAWADNSPANLYNKNGLPAVPFRIGE